MPRDNYILFEIAGRRFDIDPSASVPTIDYALEEEGGDWEQKQSATAFDISLVPTLTNQQGLNTAQNPSVLDTTPQGDFDRPLPCRYIANGYEILTGKFFLQSAVKQNGQLQKLTGNLYGLNGDWVIDLKDNTLYDFLNPRNHNFDITTIIASWAFDGRSEILDYVYAPVRYAKPFGDYPPADPNNPDAPTQPDDTNAIVNDMKPSLSIYWLLYRGFKSVGYRMKSIFFDTDYYRRSLLPWTWGGFDYLDDTRWEPLKFLAGAPALRISGDYDGYPNFNVNTGVPGGFDNSGTFQWTGSGAAVPDAMVWTFKPVVQGLGKVRANLSIRFDFAYKVQQNASVDVKVEWYKNGVLMETHNPLHEYQDMGIPGLDTKEGSEFDEDFFETDVQPGDYIAARVHETLIETGILGVGAFARLTTTIEQFKLNFLKLTEGSAITLANYPKFKEYKWLDLLRGEVDCFDLEIQTDPVRKEVTIEPRHDYDINGTKYTGFFNRLQLDFTAKEDISKESTLETFSDYEREFDFSFQNDASDGGLKKVQDRNNTTIGLAKYILPERYQTGQKALQNRFYAPLMHYEADTWRYITGIAPQLPVIVPENVANTSASEAENTYMPKRAWYKGNVSGFGGWKFAGQTYQTLPMMFAVNYKPGGEQDPVLSYADQLISGGVVAHGLLKKFYLQRMAILRKGRRYNPVWLRLNNADVTNFLHRESIVLDGLEYLLTGITGYNPLADDSTSCILWLFEPVKAQDNAACYPSITAVQSGGAQGSFDVKYWQHKLLPSDIPK